MGLQISGIVSKKIISFGELNGKVIAVDAFNAIYQFLSSIRQLDGTPLMDSKGRITSHLSGLFYRNISLLSEGIKLIYVFDGDYHPLKSKTHEKREAAKLLAEEKYEEAVDEENLEEMAKYAKGFSRLSKEMIEQSKELLIAMGIAVVQAPGEGEMQCAEIVKSGQAFAVASQDYDALIVGANRLIQNLTLSRKRKTRNGFVDIFPEMIVYSEVLKELGINSDQLISLAILVGTDFNPGGVRGLGPKKALALVREKKNPEEIFSSLDKDLDFDWREIFEIFKNPKVSKIKVEFPKLNENKIFEILVDEFEFSKERVESSLEKLREFKKNNLQRRLF